MMAAPGASERSAPIDLARESDFKLGGARVHPPSSEVVVGDQTIRLQRRVMQVLVALVRAGGQVVSRDELVASCWGGLAIGDDAINRCVGRLRRLAEDEAPGAFAIETLPRIGYRLTPANAADGTGSDAPPQRRPRAWRLAAATVAVLALAVGAWFALGRPGWPAPTEGVAIVPFETASGDTLARSFADGVADEVAGMLSKADLKALPSDMGGGLTNLQRDAAAGRLGAAFVLGGRVQQDGDALKVGVALNDARLHQILWSADFERPATEGQALQEQIASKVADVLQCALDASTYDAGQMDRQSLSLYLQGCDLITTDDPDKARDLFRRVASRVPRFANAWAIFARASALTAEREDVPPDQAAAMRREGQTAAEQALRLDPRNAVAYLALSVLVPGPNHLWERQGPLLKGLSVAPDNPQLNSREGDLLAEAGRYDEAMTFYRRAAALNPLLPYFTSALADALAQAGRLTEARTLIESAVRIWPQDSDVLSVRIAIEAQYGDPARALALLDDPKSQPAGWEAPMIDDWRRQSLVRQVPSKAAAYASDLLASVAAGRMDVSRAVRRLNSVGATEAAFAAVARSTPADPLDTEVLFRRSAAAMRRDRRFMPLAARFGLVDFWTRTGKWPDFCLAPDRPYDCRAEAAKVSR